MLLAGALHTNFVDLKREKWIVGLLATAGVVLSTVLIGLGTFYLLRILGIELSLLYCLAFGALISPTDPIAVLAILKGLKVSKSLETQIAGEALFNDGLGVVAFTVFLGLAMDLTSPTMAGVSLLLMRQVLGGVVLGLVMGWVTSLLMERSTDSQVKVMLTLGLAAGGYALATYLGTSGPIAIVTAGLVVGTRRRKRRQNVDEPGTIENFWEIVDGVLNAVLFVWIGLYLLILPLEVHEVTAGLFVIVVVLAGRFIIEVGFVNLRYFLGVKRRYVRNLAGHRPLSIASLWPESLITNTPVSNSIYMG